jgi:hypothetical protein
MRFYAREPGLEPRTWVKQKQLGGAVDLREVFGRVAGRRNNV